MAVGEIANPITTLEIDQPEGDVSVVREVELRSGDEVRAVALAGGTAYAFAMQDAAAQLRASGAVGETVELRSEISRWRPQVRDRWRERAGRLPAGRGLGMACSHYVSGAAKPVHWTGEPHAVVNLKLDFDAGITPIAISVPLPAEVRPITKPQVARGRKTPIPGTTRAARRAAAGCRR